MKQFRYGYASKEEQKRLTPKSAFLRKLERMQRAAAPVKMTIIDEAYIIPTGKTLGELFPKTCARLKLVRK
jgi:hypothetical protein